MSSSKLAVTCLISASVVTSSFLTFLFPSFMYNMLRAKSLQSSLTLCDPRTLALPVLLSMGFSRQEYWSGLPFPTSGDLPDLGIELTSLILPAWTGRFFTTGATWEAWHNMWDSINDCLWKLGRFRSLFKKYLFICLFIFGCAGSLLLQVGFLWLWHAGATL